MVGDGPPTLMHKITGERYLHLVNEKHMDPSNVVQ
jgi:hypothetical protein